MKLFTKEVAVVSIAAMALACGYSSVLHAEVPSMALKPGIFYIYSDHGFKGNHFMPSGWMGDISDIKVDDKNTEYPADGKTAIKVTYTAKSSQGAGWAGMYWQEPAGNWGSKSGGFDLTPFKRLTFWARAGGNKADISEFKVGGITGDSGDSDYASIGPVSLSKDWKKFTIDLTNKNLSHIVGGFCWSAKAEDNPNGFVMYLDEIRYER